MRSVFGWSGGYDACVEYRIRAPFDALNRTGRWRAEWGIPRADVAAEFDVLVGPRLEGYQPEWEAYCRDDRIFCVYDMDDDLLHIDPENTIPYQRYAPILDSTRRNVEIADAVTVCNEYVAEIMAKINPNVIILPICIPDEYVREPQPSTEIDHVVYGWAGSPFHHQDFTDILPFLLHFGHNTPQAWWRAYGADYSTGAFPGRTYPTVPLQPYGPYVQSISFDVGVAPLLRSPHNRGKSWTKLLEYAANGIPYVATQWGDYPEWHRESGGGLMVVVSQDWADALRYMLDPAERQRMALLQHDAAMRWRFSQHVNAWEQAYTP